MVAIIKILASTAVGFAVLQSVVSAPVPAPRRKHPALDLFHETTEGFSKSGDGFSITITGGASFDSSNLGAVSKSDNDQNDSKHRPHGEIGGFVGPGLPTTYMQDLDESIKGVQPSADAAVQNSISANTADASADDKLQTLEESMATLKTSIVTITPFILALNKKDATGLLAQISGSSVLEGILTDYSKFLTLVLGMVDSLSGAAKYDDFSKNILEVLDLLKQLQTSPAHYYSGVKPILLEIDTISTQISDIIKAKQN